ncbi:uncharacterized protein LAESUDRAFT_726390 [Laetiporus sulphureus 93-53]|uniref:Uncharacterized protein n=1 Tax=Laetiporus sulphureus 93-53 TaxID=1314785 RepID=A0A165E3R8_9APHY|nr:uncharacterized protein LAESUDRAFT_730009 [Laetiporus sulphureus 93-53]XP_040763934.1 uncharacterized protein LAESUDRAFT_726390 [Laetiporus sulphureus 93-53]KZT02516.1 hypothetical protein LAESUDRAFT_730009 [Laetiporus sulphureus 93-53]KZT06194.1 hypothetical protein LAESUDRAFT_726390 [Laetiporus sulphureus 93-53]
MGLDMEVHVSGRPEGCSGCIPPEPEPNNTEMVEIYITLRHTKILQAVLLVDIKNAEKSHKV